MIRKKFLLLLLITIFVGCTTYVYYGGIEAEDSSGEMRNHLLYWTKTERMLWFDECSEIIRLLTECSNETVIFKETEDGIVFPSNPYYKKVIYHADMLEPYGKILDVKKVSELTEDKLRLVIYCEYDSTEFTTGNHHILKAKEEPYEFDIMRKKSSEFKNGVPEPPECR
jgi:hypothetical protein